MRTLSRNIWLFPCCFSIFLSIVLMVKFIFIFFFGTAYEPEFIFEMTPLYLLSGFSKSQILFLSLLVMVLDMSLHLRSSKRRLLLSFLPTSVMLSSIGFTIMFRPMDLSSVLHYILFVCLLLVVLIDYQCVLKGLHLPTMAQKAKTEVPTVIQREPVRRNPLFGKHRKTTFSSQTSTAPPPSYEFTHATDSILQKIQAMLDELERKAARIETVEHELRERQKTIEHQQKAIANRVVPPLETKEKQSAHDSHIIRNVPADETMFLKEKIVNSLIVDETNDAVAVVQRGIFKQISNTFADFLGYGRDELLQKSFFVFIAPQGFEDARRYYLNRLKGVTTNSFRTVLLTKEHTEVVVEITVTPTLYQGDVAEYLSIKATKNSPEKT